MDTPCNKGLKQKNIYEVLLVWCRIFYELIENPETQEMAIHAA